MQVERPLAQHCILIGIDAYPEAPLRSCVQDVKAFEAFLTDSSVATYIHTLTASTNSNPSCPSPTEPLDSWPTRQNLTRVFDRVTVEARPGDFVYIHYSGHGTQTEPESDFSNTSTGDLALVLLQKDDAGTVDFLYGTTLTSMVKALVDQGLKVTLVLDCCFAAGVTRRDSPDVRCFPRFAPPVSVPMTKWTAPNNRDTSMRPNWIVDPDKYTIHAACGPHEVAKGMVLRDGRRHGVFSYNLLQTLHDTYGGLTRSHWRVHLHLRDRFQRLLHKQNPVLYGRRDVSFFAPPTEAQTTTVNRTAIKVMRDEHFRFTVEVGHAHGVCKGDEYVIYHESIIYITGGSSPQESVLFAITDVRGLKASLEPLSAPFALIAERFGWKAVLHARRGLHGDPVRLPTCFAKQDTWNVESRGRSLEAYVSDEHKDKRQMFHVARNQEGDYLLQDDHHRNLFICQFALMAKSTWTI